MTATVQEVDRTRTSTGAFRLPADNVVLRRMPYPYRALLAICSDLDETPSRQVYGETMRFLNTTETTSMGPGVGLEVGNSIYFDMPPGQFSYWNTDEAGRALVRTLIRSGHIDCLHSYGDLAATRAHAGRALDELSRHGCQLETWVDHAVAPSNFGSDIMCGRGDLAGSNVFHADLTCGFGIKYVWRGRITSAIGQDTTRCLGGIYDRRHSVASTKTLLKEFVKGILAAQGSTKYAMHGPNNVLREVSLRSGHPVVEFMRCNPHWGGVSRGETATGLAEVLVAPMLDDLIKREGMCVLYTHLGKIRRPWEPFGPRTRNALSLLAAYARDGKILVTTTRRLLGYCHAKRSVELSTTVDDDRLTVALRVPQRAGPSVALEDLAGLTVYVSDPLRTHVRVNDREVRGVVRNPPDHTGRKSVSLPWRAMEYPHL